MHLVVFLLNQILLFIFISQVPCVGFSVGIERIFVLLQSKLKENVNINNFTPTKVYLCSPKPGLLHEKLDLLQNLRENEIPVSYLQSKLL